MRTIGALVFPGFEMLDVFGPLEMFGMLPEEFRIRMVAQTTGQVACAQGPAVVVDDTFDSVDFDLILVPGGPGTRKEVDNPTLVEWIRTASISAELVTSVCTGSALLAAANVLDGRRATTNKRAFAWVCSKAPHTTWIRRARWVKDGNVYTSSGVSAGIDMSVAVISEICGRQVAEQVCNWAEYGWNDDPHRDPFASRDGVD